jgi:regulator of protease activity HflC (stomatin/prohibitin superfamily)
MMLPFTSCVCTVIEDGQVGVRRRLGRIHDQPLSAGLKFKNPIITVIEKWNIKTQELTEQASVPSSEGLISSLDVTVIYNVNPADAVKVRKTIGKNYREVVLRPYVRKGIRVIASGYPVKSLFSDEGRIEIGRRLLEMLREDLEPRGITIQDVLLRDVKLPSTFLSSIEAKLKAEQEALQKEFELQKAKKDAEIEIARAKGAAEANRIIAGSITPEYIQYLWVQGLNDEHSEVIYVPTEANLPILEALRGGKR